MDNENVLSPAEELVMRQAFRATMLRAADVIEKLTEEDVMDARLALLHMGVHVSQLHKVDRCALGAAHLRACAEQLKTERAIAQFTLKTLIAEVKS